MYNPWSVILFSDNAVHRRQVRHLIDDIREQTGRETPIMVDCEGGKVQRLKKLQGIWDFPSADTIGQIYQRNPDDGRKLARLVGYCIGRQMAQLGINIVAAPVCDVRRSYGHDIIGSRSFGSTGEAVSELSTAMAVGLMQAGVMPIAKHFPGHGAATVDSHKGLPVLPQSWDELEGIDLAAFAFKSMGRYPAVMTGHLVVPSIDKDHPASVSTAFNTLAREVIGPDTLVISDGLRMNALAEYGDIAARAVKVIEAGGDIALVDQNKLGELIPAAQALPPMSSACLSRIESAWLEVARHKAPRTDIREDRHTICRIGRKHGIRQLVAA